MAAGMNMHCPKCGVEAAPGKRFCADCGATLPMRCPKCGAEAQVGKPFCADCGAALCCVPSTCRKAGPVSERRQRRGRSGGDSRRRAQDGHCAVRRHQGLDRVERGPRSRRRRAVVDPALKLMMDAVKLAGQERSTKHRKAEDFINEGHTIRIISESDFQRIAEQQRNR